LIFTRAARAGRDVARISQIDARMFERACRAIGVEDFHFHDLRHTRASWHVQAGTPLMVLKELSGWERVEMVRKYASWHRRTSPRTPKRSRFGHSRHWKKQPPLLAAAGT